MHELLVRLSAGEDVVNDVIIHEMTLVMKLSHRFQIAYPRKQMDIISVALLALVRGVNLLYAENPTAEEIEPTLNVMIRNAILTFLNDDKLIPVPRSTKYDANQKGESIIEPSIFNINICGDEGDYEIRDNSYCEMMEGKELQEHYNCVLNQHDKEILEARLKGMSLKEIAISRGCSQQYVGQLLNKLRRKCYAISIHAEQEDILQRRWLLQRRKDTSKKIIHDESVHRTCVPLILEPVSNNPNV